MQVGTFVFSVFSYNLLPENLWMEFGSEVTKAFKQQNFYKITFAGVQKRL